MDFKVQVFQISKLGTEPDKCQDAIFYNPHGRLFAIADGATDSAFQRLWAGLLVKGFVSHPPSFSKPSNVKEWFGGWLKAQQETWNNSIPWDTIKYHGQIKAKTTGGLATFLGIYFFSDRPVWKGISFGDCNLFHFLDRGRYLFDYKPLISPEQFNSNPVALSSIDHRPGVMLQHMMEIGGEYHEGDVIFLTTDALALWLLEELESDRCSWDKLLNFQTPGEFEVFIDKLRKNKEIRNDDTSLVIIEILNAPQKLSRSNK